MPIQGGDRALDEWIAELLCIHGVDEVDPAKMIRSLAAIARSHVYFAQFCDNDLSTRTCRIGQQSSHSCFRVAEKHSQAWRPGNHAPARGLSRCMKEDACPMFASEP